MKSIFNFLKHFSLFLFLTIITQVGGLIYLLFLPINQQLKKRIQHTGWRKRVIHFSAFFTFYLFISLLIVPSLAKQFGRVPLPLFATKEIPVQPRHYFYVLANRHYIKPELKRVVFDVTKDFTKKYPKAKILYLDACFPFVDGMPLLPHLSHSDGKKLDICFIYKDKSTAEIISKTPTWIGYGSCESPRPNEFSQPEVCKKAGYFQYGALKRLTPTLGKSKLEFDEKANRELVRYFVKHPSIGKIFIEPHLKTRLGLSNYNKIRFHGCRAVRHDDHIHVQL